LLREQPEEVNISMYSMNSCSSFDLRHYAYLEVIPLLCLLPFEQELNAMFSKPLKELLSTDEGEVDDVALISMDSKGIDIRVRQGAQVQPSEDL
jgi:hypothetical protein